MLKRGLFYRTQSAHPGVLVDAGEIGEIEQAGAVVGNDEAGGLLSLLAFPGRLPSLALADLHLDRLDAEPGRDVGADVLLRKRLAFDAVRIASQRERPVLEIRKEQRSDGVVIPDDIALGVAFAGIEDFVEVGKLEAVAVHDGRHGLGFSSEEGRVRAPGGFRRRTRSRRRGRIRRARCRDAGQEKQRRAACLRASRN